MRIVKLLVLGAMVLALTPVLALAETPPGCGGVGLDETLLPSGLYFHIGESICYEAWLAINAPKCDMEDVEVRFWRPDDVPPNPLNICGSPGGSIVESGLYIAQGAAPIVLDCGTYGPLDYTVQAGDVVIVEDIPTVVAYICITGTQLVGPPSLPGQDAKAIPNFVLAPCIEVTKEACEYSKEGDTITYSICVKNCSDAAVPGGPVIPTTLYNVVVNDPMLGGDLAGFPSELAPGQEECLDFTYTVTSSDMSPLENTVTASGEDVTGFMVSDTATETVTLLDPEINVTVECQGGADIGADATFRVYIENLGDVALDVTTDDARVNPGQIAAGGFFETFVDEGPMACPEICYTINIDATIPGEFCDLPNLLEDSASDCCPCLCTPCIQIDKSVDCDVSKVGDDVIYTIRIENCGDIVLTGIVVTDPHISASPLAGFPSTLAIGEFASVDFTYTVQADDEDPGVDYPDDIMTNMASVIADYACGDDVGTTDDDSDLVDVRLIDPSFEIFVTCLGGADIGDDALFAVTVMNTGDVSLNVTTDDGRVGPYSIAAGDYREETVAEGPMECPEICYTLNADATLPVDLCDLPNVLTDSKSDCCPCLCNPCIEIEKSVDCDVSKVGDDVIYTIRIMNCGDIPIENVVVTDPHIDAGPLAGFPSTLPPDGQWYSVDFTYTVQADDEDPGVDFPDDIMTNMANVVGDWTCGADPGSVDEDSNPVDVRLIDPSYEVNVTCLGGVDIGEPTLFGVSIINTGDVPLDITTDDGLIGPYTIAVGDYRDETVGKGPMECPEICYTLNVEGRIPSEYCDLPNVIEESDDDCCPCLCNPCIEIEKSVDCDVSKVGDDVIYTIRIMNCGDIPIENVVVTDPHIDAGPLAGFPSTLPPDGQWYSVDFTYTVQADDEDPGVDFPDDIMTNMANVVGDWTCGADPGSVDEDSNPVDVRLIDPEVNVGVSCQGGANVGADATFRVRIDNLGDVALDVTTDDAGVTPGQIAAGGFFEVDVDKGPMECPEFCYTINIDATIPSEFCELPNLLEDSASDCCPCICTPCIEIEKIVDCDISKVGDDVVYTIRIRNCGDIDLTGIVVTDPQISPDPLVGFPTELAAGSGWTSEDFTYTIVSGDEPGPVINITHVVADYACGDDVGTTDDDSEPIEVTLIHPAFTVEKVCVEDPLTSGATEAWYTVTISNTGDVALDITTDDGDIAPFTLPDGNSFTQDVSEPVPAGVGSVCNKIIVTATIPSMYCDLQNVYVDSAEACCEIAGAHGCTPGYWKNQTECWECYTTSTPICDVFTFPAGPLYDFFCGGNVTLHKALKFGGGDGIVGKARNLMRHGVAALLNSCDSDVNYGMNPAGVIAMVNDALATEDEDEIIAVKNQLAAWNERGCSQDAHCRPQEPEDGPGGTTGLAPSNPTTIPDDSRSTGDQGLLQSELAVPREFSVRGVPNPAGTSSSIRYAIPMDSKVTVEILDVQGRLITKLLDQHMPAGSHTVAWDGNGAPAGVYFCKVQCCDGKETISKVIKVQ